MTTKHYYKHSNNIKLILITLLLTFGLGACSSKSPVYSPIPESESNSSRLDSLLARATESNLEVARLEAASLGSESPQPAADLPEDVRLPDELQRLASVDWTGPVEPLLQALADHVGYTYQVTGPAPAQPLIVTIARRDEPIWLLMRDVAISLTSAATVIVNPARKLVSLQYPVHQ